MSRDQRTRAQPRSVTQPPIRDGSGRGERKADRRRPRGEWNHRPPVPDGSQVYHGASQTLDVVGIADEIDKSGRYEPLRPQIWSMDRKTEANEIRRLGAAPDVMLGSVHAVTETGSLLAASMSGSQLGPYVSGAGRVILVVGTQKIVRDLEEGLLRINEYAYRLEDARAQAAYGIRSAVNKVVVINREITPGRITVVLVDEVLGF